MRFEKLRSSAFLLMSSASALLLSISLPMLLSSEEISRSMLGWLLISGAIATTVSHILWYVFSLQPLLEIDRYERDPLGEVKRINSKFPKLQPVKRIISIYNDFIVQRDAYQRLITAYRELNDTSQASPKINELLEIGLNSKLATESRLYLVHRDSQRAGASTPEAKFHLEEIARSGTDHSSDVPFLSERELESCIAECLALDRHEFSGAGLLYCLQERPEKKNPKKKKDDEAWILLGVQPRRLWAKRPQLYREFYETLTKKISQIEFRTERDFTPQETIPLDEIKRINISSIDEIEGHTTTELPHFLGLCHHHLNPARGCFIFLNFHKQSKRSFLLLGESPGQGFSTTLSTGSSIALISTWIQDWHSREPSQLISEVAEALHRFHQEYTRNTQGIALTAMIIDHQRGTGTFANFSQPLPYLLSPGERRPHVLMPKRGNQGPLGLQTPQSTETTDFHLLHGQSLVLCSSALLRQKERSGRTFEDEISRGKLGHLLDNRRQAETVARQVLHFAERKSEQKEYAEDRKDFFVICAQLDMEHQQSQHEAAASTSTPENSDASDSHNETGQVHP